MNAGYKIDHTLPSICASVYTCYSLSTHPISTEKYFSLVHAYLQKKKSFYRIKKKENNEISNLKIDI